MALGFEAGLGAIGGLFGKPKLKQIKYSDAVDAELGNQVANLKATTTANNATLAAYQAAADRMRPMVSAAADDDVGLLGRLNTRELSYDPLSAYERLRAGNLAAFDDQLAKASTRGSVADKLAMSARGYGGRGSGAYEQILRNRVIGSTGMPVLNSIFNNLGNDTTATDLARQRTNAGILANIGARRAIPLSVLDFEAMPIDVRNRAMMASIAGLGGLGDIARTNTAGFKEEKNSVANFLEGMGKSLDQVGGTALSVAGSLYGGGMLGGMFGGGGGAPAPSTPFPTTMGFGLPQSPSYPSSVGWGAQAPSYYQPNPYFAPPSYADPRLFFGRQ